MSKRGEADDPVTYRIGYSLIAQKLHELSEGREEDAPFEERLGERTEFVSAVIAAAGHSPQLTAKEGSKEQLASETEGALSGQALRLIEMTATELRGLGWRWVGSEPSRYVKWARRRGSPEDAHLGKFLDRVMEPAAVVLYWSCLANEGDWESVERLLQDARRIPARAWRVPWRSWRSGWRMWRRYRRQIDRRRFTHKWQPEKKAWLEDYLVVLASSSGWKLPLFGRLLAKLGLTRLRPVPAPDYRVHYNLACLYSRLAGRWSQADRQAQEYLERATEQWALCLAATTGAQENAIAQWARRDPALRALRD